MRCSRLPFGYIDSPRLFCGLTESVAEIFRKRVAGLGIHVFVFVDDFLVVGDTKELAAEGNRILKSIFEDLGLPFAPHKQRGPARVMEFLGLLLVNVPGMQCLALSEKRQTKMRILIDEWRARRPGGELAGAKELASLLWKLVFASQVVPGGRTYMQQMLASFQGLEVDWRRGTVRPTADRAKGWRAGVALSDGFWRDLDWWSDQLERRNCVMLTKRRPGVAALCGTDASDWGTGQLMWRDGQRAEVSLEFTEAERQRSINWRELLGIVRVLETYGEELSGTSLLIEGDNTSSLAAATKGTSKAHDSQELVTEAPGGAD